MNDLLPLAGAAALWGAAAGALLPRAAYRFSVPAGEPWRAHCPAGHPLRGWLGPARCARCAGDPASAPVERPAGTAGAADTAAPASRDAGTAMRADVDSSAPRDADVPERHDADAPGTGDIDAPERRDADVPEPGHIDAPEPRDADAPVRGDVERAEPDTGPATPEDADRAVPADRAQAPGPPKGAGMATDPGPIPDVRPAPASAPAPGAPRTLPTAVVTALVCAVLAAATGARPEIAVWLLLAPVGVLLALVDLRVRRLPDVLTLPLAGAALALLGLAALVPEHAGHWPTALYGALALGAGYFVLFLINPSGMGFGDVKLALGAGAVLGWYGWPTVLLGTFAGFLLGALYGGALVVTRRAGRKSAIAFGPFLIAGAFLGLLLGAYAA